MSRIEVNLDNLNGVPVVTVATAGGGYDGSGPTLELALLELINQMAKGLGEDQ